MTEKIITDLEAKALEYIRTEIPRLERHLTGTRDFALEINSLHKLGYEDDKVALAALCHDFARLVKPEKIPDELRRRGIDPDLFNTATPILLHGPLSAELAKEVLGLTDGEILNAITWHATGRGGMSVLDKLIYVADKVEINRHYPGVETLRDEVRRDFHDGFRIVLGTVLKYVIAQGWPIDYNSVAAWNEAILRH